MLKNIVKLLSLIFFIFCAASAFAQPRVVDNAGLLELNEQAALVNLINSISKKYNFDLVIVTEKSINGLRPVDYADDFFDYNGYGLGQGRDGCLFLHVTGSRDYWFSTSGRGIDILNSAAFNKLEADAVKFLRAGINYEAYYAFLENWEEFLALEAAGRSYNIFYQYNAIFVIIAWILALIIGSVIVQTWKNRMNTALAQTQASAYVVPGSLSFKTKKDIFLYSTVTRTVRQTDSSGGRSHTSSSGRSHGGGGGRY
ncbi:MAG: TPM domain-containing protein [Treponema sp.]|nr:TPM domain-containing protein [Treponema sp.]